ncbi:hypothetical protein [Algoriphagus sp.]|uniref:hypothetical protein n=1 Tax=Algoriphagus sp. TaxID=1872435 RepID=UPI0027342A62|nr:hypothetical protein [Algoriphagus sp.]
MVSRIVNPETGRSTLHPDNGSRTRDVSADTHVGGKLAPSWSVLGFLAKAVSRKEVKVQLLKKQDNGQ